jgi:hypothetical protein
MKKILFFLLFPFSLLAQFQHGFKYGAITYADLSMKEYGRDTSAVALVLNEFGDSYIQDEEPYDLQMEYHVKIKIMKKEGLSFANYEIPLQIGDSKREEVNVIEASTFNLENNRIVESKLDTRNIFNEDRSKYWSYKKFALPNVRVGSIIEIRYIFTSPFIFNWRTWEFQSDIPKVATEFWARIPANYLYNIVLRGTLALSKNKSELVKDCFTVGAGKADCALYNYAMTDVPAFKEEDYMTSKENFLSAVNYELVEITQFDGQKTKYTEEWTDVDRKLATAEYFGDNVRQARKIWDDQIELLTKVQTDPLAKARIVFETIKKYYAWNENYGSYSELGAKKAYQSKKGNVADINLSLVGALQAAGLQADPVMLSTRKNGIPIMLHPVMTGFNYTIARVTVGQDQYWLDATHRLYPFGFVPERCLNGKVRVMSKVSEWVDLKPKDKDKKASELTLSVTKEGGLEGTLKVSHFGYDAFEQREKYFSYSTQEEYTKAVGKNWSHFEILGYSCQGVDSLDIPFIEKFKVAFTEQDEHNILFISPFLIERWTKNPFRSVERTYPVDFGAPVEEVTLLRLNYQNLYAVDELPKSSISSLPQAGGRYVFSVSNMNNEIQMTSNLTLNKSVYSSEEYHYLKELFSRIVQIQDSQFVLKKVK